MTPAHRIAELVSTLHGLTEQAEAEWRRQRLPPLSRDSPRPDPEAMQGARTLEAACRALDMIGGQLRSLPGVDPAGLVRRLGANAPVLLAEADEALLAHAAFLVALLARPGAAALAPDEVRAAVEHLAELARRRVELLA